MGPKALNTKFAPAKRAPEEVVKNQIEKFRNNDVLNKFLSKLPAIFIILNEYRQVVYMNKGALEFTGLADLTSIIGKRPGEVLGCIHKADEEGGCGTSESCTYCGAINIVLKSQKGVSSVEDCRLTCGPDEFPFDLRMWASPLDLDGKMFTILTLQDISHEKRREIFERIFFHDILNTINGLSSALQLLLECREEVDDDLYLNKMNYFTENLIEEVKYHRMLVAAENNTLELNYIKIDSLALLKELINNYSERDIAKLKNIHLDTDSVSKEIITDRILLRRILTNMLNNALEEIPERTTVSIGNAIKDDNLEFWVHNPGEIPRNAQLQIFQRSFSTKGKGRGIGTYSMKILSTLLNGTVSFTSSKEKGTIFKASFPLKPSLIE